MSVIIKNMKKPPKCEWLDNERNLQRCKLLINDDCALQDCDDSWTWEELYARCPLDELPEKHGRLIDADETLKRHCTEHCRKKPSCEEDCVVYDLLHLVKSVIEAEGE